MIDSKVDKKYNIWVMLGLGLFSILASAFNISQSYAEFFAGKAVDIVNAIFQIILIDGIMAVVIAYIWAIILHNIMSRGLRQLYITRFDFCFYYMFFMALARVVMAIIGAFQFLAPNMAVYVNYMSSLVFSTTAMAIFFFVVLKKAYIPQGKWSNAFKSLAIPFVAIYAINYFTAVFVWISPGNVEEMLDAQGWITIYYANEIYAVIASAVVLALIIGGAFGAYFWLKKKDKDAPMQETTILTPPKKEERVFEEFDI